MVLKTTAASGALGSAARVTGCLVRGSVPSTAAGSPGDGDCLVRGSRGGAGPEDGPEGARADGLAERGEHLLSLDAARLEVLGEEIVVRLRHCLRELLAPALGVVHDLARDVALFYFAVHDGERLHGDEIDEPLEARLAADGHLEWTQRSEEHTSELQSLTN